MIQNKSRKTEKTPGTLLIGSQHPSKADKVPRISPVLQALDQVILQVSRYLVG